MNTNRMKIGLAAVLVTLSVFTAFTPIADADFNQNNIMSDAVMNDYNSMTANDIDTFLNSFIYSCISTNNGFAAKLPTGYNPSSGYLYGDYASAGQVIHAAAQAYQINPRVLITTLEKEQNLVTGRNSSTFCGNPSDQTGQNKYAAAVGYGCPDGGVTYSYSGLSLYRRNGVVATSVSTCVNSSAKAGFSQQLIRAAWMLKYSQERSLGNTSWAIITGSWDNSDDLTSCYSGPMTQGTFKRCPSGAAAYYDGYYTIDDSSVHLDTGATAALYRYTPHFHGNQLFVSLYEQWFGSTVVTVVGGINIRYQQLGGEGGLLGKPIANEVALGTNGKYQPFENGYIVGTASTGYWESMGPTRGRWAELGYQTGKMGYPVGPITTSGDAKTAWQEYQNGYIIWGDQTGAWESKGAIRVYWAKLGYQTGKMGYPVGPEMYDGKGWWQAYENGAIVGTASTGYWESMGPTRGRWAELGYQTGKMGYPVGPITTSGDAKTAWQEYQNGYIIWGDQTGAWESKGAIRVYWAKLGYQTGKAGFPIAAELFNTDQSSWYQLYQNGTIYSSINGTSWFTKLAY